MGVVGWKGVGEVAKRYSRSAARAGARVKRGSLRVWRRKECSGVSGAVRRVAQVDSKAW